MVECNPILTRLFCCFSPGVTTQEPDGGSMKGLAFAYDPDGYSIEIIKRGGIDFGDALQE